MAEPTTSESSPETDRDFDPSAEMLINEYDDERTLDEEEALSGDSCSNELDDLQKEGDMPIEDLLAMYGYGGQESSTGLHPPSNEMQDTRSSSEEEILSNQDLTLDKDEIARDLLKEDDNETETSVHDLMDSVMPSHTVRLLRSKFHAGSDDDDSDDEEFEPVRDDDWKKTIQVGSDYQAVVPEGLCKYGDAPAYENEDRLLWDPSKLEDKEVEHFLTEVHKQNQQSAQGVQAIPTGTHIRDDEQALYLLLQCGHNAEEALRRRKMQAVPPTDPMSLWSEEECRNFENGLRTYGKDFYLVQQNKVRTRSVGELVQFYYLWKKTERHDVFANKTRLEKKKYILHPGVTDYMDRFLDEDNPLPPRDRSASPVNSLLYGDPKRHHSADLKPASSEELAAAFEMVQKVVDPTTVFTPIKNLNPELQTATTTTVSINPDLREGQSAENIVHIASITRAVPAVADSSDSVVPESLEPSPKRLKTEPDKGHDNLSPGGVKEDVSKAGSVQIPRPTISNKSRTETENGSNHVSNVELSISSMNSVHSPCLAPSELPTSSIAADQGSRATAESVAQ